MARDLLATCYGKEAFDSAGEAYKRKRKINARKNGKKAMIMQVYKCPFCDKYHFSGRKLRNGAAKRLKKLK